MTELRKDHYNRARYRILSAVVTLKHMGCVANLNTIYKITGLSKGTVAERLNSMSNISGELIGNVDKKRTMGCIFKYKISAHGKRLLARYQERHENGETLRLKWDKPFKVDYSDFVLLPGLKDYEKE